VAENKEKLNKISTLLEWILTFMMFYKYTNRENPLSIGVVAKDRKIGHGTATRQLKALAKAIKVEALYEHNKSTQQNILTQDAIDLYDFIQDKFYFELTTFSEDMESLVTDFKDVQKKSRRIKLISTFAVSTNQLLSHKRVFIDGYKDRYDIVIKENTGNKAKVMDDVINNIVDIGIFEMTNSTAIPASLDYRYVTDNYATFVCSKWHPLYEKYKNPEKDWVVEVSIKEVAEYQMLPEEGHHSPYKSFINLLRDNGLPTLRSNDGEDTSRFSVLRTVPKKYKIRLINTNSLKVPSDRPNLVELKITELKNKEGLQTPSLFSIFKKSLPQSNPAAFKFVEFLEWCGNKKGGGNIYEFDYKRQVFDFKLTDVEKRKKLKKQR